MIISGVCNKLWRSAIEREASRRARREPDTVDGDARPGHHTLRRNAQHRRWLGGPEQREQQRRHACESGRHADQGDEGTSGVGARRAPIRPYLGGCFRLTGHGSAGRAPLAAALLCLALAACDAGGSQRDACAIPYESTTPAQSCSGSFARPSQLRGDAAHGAVWQIIVASQDPREIAGALSSFWRDHATSPITILARSTEDDSLLGYDRGVLLGRDGQLTYGVCTAWSDLGPRIGEICNDQIGFTVEQPPLVAGGTTPSASSVSPSGQGSIASSTPFPVSRGESVLVGAGDIASCSSQGDEATARLVEAIPGAVFTAGDNAYDAGSIGQFDSCYGPSWGAFKRRTHPAIGNHEYATSDAAGYFEYFGAAAGARPGGYYAFNLNGWRVYVLNSNCSVTDDCQRGSGQERWLRADLADHPVRCSLAIWHHPRFSSGLQGSEIEMQAIWQDLFDAGAELVITGHDHIYERFAPLNADGRTDTTGGIREFVVGTGGASHEIVRQPVAGSQVRNDDTFGVLALALGADGYRWQFLPEAGKTFTDAGADACH
jgi:hypothetical protein